MSLGHVTYIELKIIKAQKTQEETLTFPLTASKNLDRGSVPGMNKVCGQGGTWQWLFVKISLCVLLSPHVPTKIYL